MRGGPCQTRGMSERDTFTHAGCRVTVVDPDRILAGERADLVGPLPRPVRAVRLAVTAGRRDGEPVHEFDAVIDADEAGAGPAVLGRDPVGVFLAHRVRQGDRWAARVVDGVSTAVEGLSRWLGPPPASPGPHRDAVMREDAETGLAAAVTYADRVASAHAVVRTRDLTPAHLRAMLRVVLALVAEIADGEAADGEADALAGHAFTLRVGATTGARPGVRLADVGGLSDVVTQFRQIAVSFRYADVMARWGARRPQGILLYGPPGTGKTMLARALANEIGADLREIRTPEILDKWLGASERNIKRIFREARRYRAPTVLLFDEFDSIISYAGLGQDSGSQAINAVAGIFKQEMNDLIDDNPNVIVVATTNFPDRVDDSLIRSGRFDVKLAIPMPDERARAEIVATMIQGLARTHETRGFRLFADDVDPAGLAVASAGLTGADLREALRRTQLAKAMREAATGTRPAPIGQDDLLAAIAEVRRSPA